MQIDDSKREKKTIFGGLVTLVIVGIAIAFMTDLLIRWRSNQIIPKVTTSKQAVPFGEKFELNAQTTPFMVGLVSSLSNIPLDTRGILSFELFYLEAGIEEEQSITEALI